MPTKKEQKQDSDLNLKTRQPGKVNQNYFGNIRERVNSQAHPLDELFPESGDVSFPHEKPQLHEVPVSPPVEIPEENTGQLVSQTDVNQLTSEVNQLAGQLVNQSTSQPVSQLAIEKKYPSRRQRKLKGVRLPVQKLEKWELWCFLNKVEFQDAVEQALDWLTSQPVNHVLIDDFEDVGTNDDVLIFYHKWTGNKIFPGDKEARETVRKFSDDVCKIGIAISIYRAKTKINSFKYCIGAIEETSGTPIENNTSYLKYLESALMQKNSKKGSEK